MKMRKDERKLLIYTYLPCIALFGNLAILKDPIDKKALIIGGVLCLVIGYAHYVIRSSILMVINSCLYLQVFCQL